jgi:hypothetical protein
MLIYLSGMYLLVFQVTQHHLVSLLIAIMSGFQRWSIGATFWGVTGVALVVPRTVFLMFAPWLLLFWFGWLHEKSYWKLPAVALFIGLISNLHPVSGFFLMQLLVTITILEFGISWEGVQKLILPAIAAVAGVWPTLVNFLQNASPDVVETAVAPTPFPYFYQIIQDRLATLFPIKPEVLVFFGTPVTPQAQITIIWLYLGLMLLWLIAYLLAQRDLIKMPHPNLLFGLMLIIQLPMAFLLTRFSAPTLFIFSILYTIFVLADKPNNWDRWLLMFMTLTICYSFVAGYFLDLAWREFEIWRLTPLIGEQGRIARFIYLPLYLYTARMLTMLARQMEPGWQRTGFVVAMAFLIWRSDYTIGLIVAALCAAILMQLRYQDIAVKYPWLNLLVESIVVTLGLNVLLQAWGADGRIILPLTITYALIRLIFIYRQTPQRWTTVSGILLLFLLVIGFFQWQWRAGFQALPAKITQPFHPRMTEEERAAQALYEWAQQETAVDSLFYYDSLDFRFRAQRSLTHSWKDLGIAYYSQTLFIPFYERYQRLQDAYEAPSLLLEYAAEYEVDYIVVEAQQEVSLDLPIAFRNAGYTVYSFGG